jgi:hypothetical protein
MGSVAHASGLFPRNQETKQQREGPEMGSWQEVAEGRHEMRGQRRSRRQIGDEALRDSRSPDGVLEEGGETPFGGEFA